MRVVILGIGKVGETLCDMLSGEGHDVIIIDKNYKTIENTVNTYDVLGFVGNGATYRIQNDAEVSKADLFIACSPSDELNIMSCTVARKIGAKSTIARVRNPEYHEQLKFMYNDMGINLIINPEFEAASEIEKIIRFPSATKIETFAKGHVDLAEIRITEDHKLAGKALSELKNLYNPDMLVCAVQRQNDVYIPSGDFIIQSGDNIHVTAPHEQLGILFKELGVLKKRIKNVMLIGGGKISFYLAKNLSKININVKIIEIDKERCEVLSGLLPKATIINADGTDSDVLVEEGIDGMDACVSLTDIDEENIIVSMFADSQNVEKIVTKITRQSFVKMLPHMGIVSSIVSPRLITANFILRYARAKSNSKGSRVRTLYRIIDNRVEAIEFSVAENFKGFGVQLKDLKIRKNILIACILRDSKEVIHPNGSTTIEPGDRVIIVTTNEQLLDLNDILL